MVSGTCIKCCLTCKMLHARLIIQHVIVNDSTFFVFGYSLAIRMIMYST
jgi:uncharacterized membrane protein